MGVPMPPALSLELGPLRTSSGQRSGGSAQCPWPAVPGKVQRSFRVPVKPLRQGRSKSMPSVWCPGPSDHRGVGWRPRTSRNGFHCVQLHRFCMKSIL